VGIVVVNLIRLRGQRQHPLTNSRRRLVEETRQSSGTVPRAARQQENLSVRDGGLEIQAGIRAVC